MYSGEILMFKESIEEAFLAMRTLNSEEIKDQIAKLIILIEMCAINIACSTESLGIEMTNIFETTNKEVDQYTPITIRNDKLDELANVLKNHLGPILPLFQSEILERIDSFAKHKVKMEVFTDDFNELRVSLKVIQDNIEVFYRKFDLYGAIWKMKIIS